MIPAEVMSSMPRLAIGIVSYERGRLTQRLLDSIAACTATPHRVFVADNGSRDSDTRSLLARWEGRPDTTVIRLAENLGPSSGRNAILERISDDFDVVAMLDNDIVVLEGWDMAALRAVGDGYDAVAPKLLRCDERTVDRGPFRAWKEPFLAHPEYVGAGARRDAAIVSERVEVPVVGGTAIFRSAIFRRVGRYDSRIWLGEDFDLAYRARGEGFRFCYEPKCEMVHDHPYEPEYDQARSDPARALASHFAIWERHGRLLLSPSALRLFPKIVNAREPMFLDRAPSPSGIARRIRRRIWKWSANRLGEIWRSAEEGEQATLRAMREISARPLM